MRKLLYILLLHILFFINISCQKDVQNYILDKNTKDTIASFILKEDMGYLIISNQLNFDDKEQIKNIANLLKVQELYTEKNEYEYAGMIGNDMYYYETKDCCKYYEITNSKELYDTNNPYNLPISSEKDK